MKKIRFLLMEYKVRWRNTFSVILAVGMILTLCACGKTDIEQSTVSQTDNVEDGAEDMENTGETKKADTLENLSGEFVLIPGGTFQMGSPENEAWRLKDETQHAVTDPVGAETGTLRKSPDRIFLMGRQYQRHCRGDSVPDRGRPV